MGVPFLSRGRKCSRIHCGDGYTNPMNVPGAVNWVNDMVCELHLSTLMTIYI